MRSRLTFTVLILALGTAGVALADSNLTRDVPAHRHFLTANNSEVGPRLCDNPALQNAFNQFHVNVHSATIRGTPIGATGLPAPGLHDGHGPTIRPDRC